MKCKKCTYYDIENEFCYYYLLKEIEFFNLNKENLIIGKEE